jgi:hypothetical protein
MEMQVVREAVRGVNSMIVRIVMGLMSWRVFFILLVVSGVSDFRSSSSAAAQPIVLNSLSLFSNGILPLRVDAQIKAQRTSVTSRSIFFLPPETRSSHILSMLVKLLLLPMHSHAYGETATSPSPPSQN